MMSEKSVLHLGIRLCRVRMRYKQAYTFLPDLSVPFPVHQWYHQWYSLVAVSATSGGITSGGITNGDITSGGISVLVV